MFGGAQSEEEEAVVMMASLNAVQESPTSPLATSRIATSLAAEPMTPTTPVRHAAVAESMIPLVPVNPDDVNIMKEDDVAAEAQSRRTMEYLWWLQYVHHYFPSVRLSRPKEDLCDACTRIETLLLNPNISDPECAELVVEKELHLDAAINQRRDMSAFAKQYVARKAADQTIPEEIIPDHGEIPLNMEPVVRAAIPTLQIQLGNLEADFLFRYTITKGHRRTTSTHI
ncbi:hypothetical protein GQ600_18050 [Phytophthora cactorum]|nr:hypothetical protein GQ600_18050 [Phytophthora cactorum]